MEENVPQDPLHSTGPRGPSAERVAWLIRTGRMRAPRNPGAWRPQNGSQTRDPAGQSLAFLLEERDPERAR